MNVGDEVVFWPRYDYDFPTLGTVTAVTPSEQFTVATQRNGGTLSMRFARNEWELGAGGPYHGAHAVLATDDERRRMRDAIASAKEERLRNQCRNRIGAIVIRTLPIDAVRELHTWLDKWAPEVKS